MHIHENKFLNLYCKSRDTEMQKHYYTAHCNFNKHHPILVIFLAEMLLRECATKW